MRELSERDAARAPLALDALGLVEVLDVAADEFGGGHVSTPFVEIPVGHTTAAWPPAARVVTSQPRPSDTPLHLAAAVAELRLVVRLGALLSDDQCGGWNGVCRRHRARGKDRRSTSRVPLISEYHFEYQTDLKCPRPRAF
jgi:hypothetical protein